MVDIRGSLALDETIVEALAIDDPRPELLDELERDFALNRVDQRTYLVRQAALTLALLVWNDEQ
jgi:hypothetical protein